MEERLRSKVGGRRLRCISAHVFAALFPFAKSNKVVIVEELIDSRPYHRPTSLRIDQDQYVTKDVAICTQRT